MAAIWKLLPVSSDTVSFGDEDLANLAIALFPYVITSAHAELID
jgi:hypothetical protein